MGSSNDRPIRVAILEADVPLAQTSADYGSYGGVFTSLLHQAADASKIPRESLELSGWDVVNADGKPEGEEEKRGGMYDWTRRRGYPNLDDLDAVLITGSRAWVFLACAFSFGWGVDAVCDIVMVRIRVGLMFETHSRTQFL